MSEDPNGDQQLENAWRMIRHTVEQAEKRYGLELFGRIEKIEKTNVIVLRLISVKQNRQISHKITFDTIKQILDRPMSVGYAEASIMPLVREMARERDRKWQLA